MLVALKEYRTPISPNGPRAPLGGVNAVPPFSRATDNTHVRVRTRTHTHTHTHTHDDPAIPFLGLYLRKLLTKAPKGSGTRTFIAVSLEVMGGSSNLDV